MGLGFFVSWKTHVVNSIVIFELDGFCTSPVHGHDDDCSEDDGEDDEDGDEEVEVHVQGGEGAHELHVTVLLRRIKMKKQEREAGRCPP